MKGKDMASKRVVQRFNLDGQKIVFRYPTPRDARDYLEIINSLVAEKAMISYQKKTTRKEEEKWLKSCLKKIRSKKQIVLAVEVDGKLMGTSGLLKPENDSMAHTGTFGISLRREIRRRGIGKKLMMCVIKEAKRVFGVRIILLEVFGKNKIAQRLYRSCGFKVLGRIKKGIRYYDKGLDDRIIMIKYL